MTHIKSVLSLLLLLFVAACSRGPVSPSLTDDAIVGATGQSVTGPAAAAAAAARPRAVLDQAKKVVGIRSLPIGGSSFDVTFSAGSLSYAQARAALPSTTARKMTEFSSQAAGTDAMNAIRGFFNTSVPPITAEDVAWDTLSNQTSRGEVLVPYAVTATDVPFSRTEWEAPTQSWRDAGLFSFEMDRLLQSAGAWAFFVPTKGGGN